MIESLNEVFPRPDWVRRINAMGDSVGGAANLISIDAADLVETASRTTGLDDFGDFDGDWRGRLESLVGALNEEANLNTVGRLMFRQELLRSLRTRLFMTRKLAAHPEILDEEIVKPIIVTGPGRSGTSILFELLSLDPQTRAIRGYDSAHPVDTGEGLVARMAMTECEQEFWCDVVPEMSTIHEHRADLPVECITPTMASFGSFIWWITAKMESWAPDWIASMQFHKLFLQMLQFDEPGPTWVLKTPVYLPILDLVFATYPDASVVLTHRDPLKTVPSGASTLAAVRWQRSDDVDPLNFIADGGTGTYDLMLHVKQRRDAGELPDQIVDLHFRDQMKDPVAAIRGAYAKFGLEFSDEHAARITQYLADKPKGKFGSHHYDLSDWGYTKEGIRERSKTYVETFGVELED